MVAVNLTTLLLARNLARWRDIVVEAALGASRVRIVRRLLAESLLLAALGGLCGVVVARWATSLLLALRPRSLSLVYPDHVTVDATVVGYGLVLSIVIAVMLGAASALRVVGADLLSKLHGGDPHSTPTGTGRWLFRGAVGLQAALALMLLIAAGLMISSFLHLKGHSARVRTT